MEQHTDERGFVWPVSRSLDTVSLGAPTVALSHCKGFIGWGPASLVFPASHSHLSPSGHHHCHFPGEQPRAEAAQSVSEAGGV